MLDGYQPGQLAPMLRAERDLARARLAARDGRPRSRARRSPRAIAGLRQQSTPYHLAHGLLDYAGYLGHLDDDEAAEAAIGEARDIGRPPALPAIAGPRRPGRCDRRPTGSGRPAWVIARAE